MGPACFVSRTSQPPPQPPQRQPIDRGVVLLAGDDEDEAVERGDADLRARDLVGGALRPGAGAEARIFVSAGLERARIARVALVVTVAVALRRVRILWAVVLDVAHTVGVAVDRAGRKHGGDVGAEHGERQNGERMTNDHTAGLIHLRRSGKPGYATFVVDCLSIKRILQSLCSGTRRHPLPRQRDGDGTRHACVYARRLQECGFSERQAEGQAQALAAAMTDTFVTKQDLRELEIRVDAQLAAVRHDVRELETRMDARFSQIDARFEYLEKHLDTRLAEQEKRMALRFDEQGARYAEQSARFDGRLADLERRITLRMVGGIAVVSALVKLL